MVTTLIDLRATILRHTVRRVPLAGLLALVALGLLGAAGTVALGAAHYAHPGAGGDVLALVFAVWMLGRVGQAALTGGDGTLHPELFRLLPVDRRRLARALLVVDLVEPSLVVPAIAYGALVALGARAGAAAALVAIAAAVLMLVATSVLCTLGAGLLAPGSRRGRDTGTVVLALAISVVALAGTLLPILTTILTDRTSPILSLVVRILPSGWGPVAVDAAARSSWALTAAALLGLVALSAAACVAWPWVLARRMEGVVTPTHTVGAHRLRVFPRTPVAAVTLKELDLWVRDPVRLTFLLIAATAGVATCAIPQPTTGTDALLPFGGALAVVIAGACATNLYATDASSLWLTIMTPHGARPDVRGRQAAWLLLVAPYAVVTTVVLTAIGGQGWAWPWVLAGLPALLGGAAGLAAYGSLVSVQPADEGGNPTPAWSLKVHVALPLVALAAAPPALVLGTGALTDQGWLDWAAVPGGIATGIACTVYLGRAAVRRLERDQLAVLGRLADSGRPVRSVHA